jgi:hypothetical protein
MCGFFIFDIKRYDFINVNDIIYVVLNREWCYTANNVLIQGYNYLNLENNVNNDY